MGGRMAQQVKERPAKPSDRHDGRRISSLMCHGTSCMNEDTHTSKYNLRKYFKSQQGDSVSTWWPEFNPRNCVKVEGESSLHKGCPLASICMHWRMTSPTVCPPTYTIIKEIYIILKLLLELEVELSIRGPRLTPPAPKQQSKKPSVCF